MHSTVLYNQRERRFVNQTHSGGDRKYLAAIINLSVPSPLASESLPLLIKFPQLALDTGPPSSRVCVWMPSFIRPAFSPSPCHGSPSRPVANGRVKSDVPSCPYGCSSHPSAFTQTVSGCLIMCTSAAAFPLLIQILIKRPSSPSLVPVLAGPSIPVHKPT